MDGNVVTYYRVSTQRQGRSGLGVEAQMHSVRQYLNGGTWNEVASFREHESGKIAERPELDRALAACRVHQATLVVARIDRLGRNAAHIFRILDQAGVDVVFVELPGATRFTVGVYALAAEDAGAKISENTRAALAASKARGKVLGTPRNLTAEARAKGRRAAAAARTAAATARAADLDLSLIAELRESGATTLAAIARALNDRHVPTARGCAWTPTAVSRVLRRIAAPLG